MRPMTREALTHMIRRNSRSAGSLSAYARRYRVNMSTLSNMLQGRNRWTPRVLSLLGLSHVRVVEAAASETGAPVQERPVRETLGARASTYVPMWRLGDWPSRYRAAAVVELED